MNSHQTTSLTKCFNIFREELRELPNKINESISKKDYLAAALLVVKAQETMQGPLQHVEGLKDVKADVATRSEVMLLIYWSQTVHSMLLSQRFYQTLIEELCHCVYVKTSNDVLQWKRIHNSNQNPFQRASSGRNSSGRASGNASKADAPKAKSLMLEIIGNNQRYRVFALCCINFIEL